MPGALLTSAISSLTGMLPYIFIWLIVKKLIEPGTTNAQVDINVYAWWAAGTAIGGVILYFLALTLSHLAAFRVETSMRRVAMERIVRMPLGFFDKNTSGRIRKIIDDNASITHSFLAHQLPDLAGTILMPFAAMILIFVFDWRLGLACLVPIIFAMGIMGSMMGGTGQKFMKMYMNSLEEMNTEAVEYVRGIPVVKVFQQTVFSFKNFHNSIMKYRDMVIKYTKLWEKPMSTYTVVIHGFVYVLIPLSILLIGNSGTYATILINLFFYILITPVFGQSIMKSMYLNQAFGQAKEAVTRMESLTDVEPLPIASAPKSIDGNDISFKNVVFNYPGATQNAVDGLSFHIPAGKTVALVGASGSGKTTIARLVPRFWDAKEGEVCIGGVDVKEIEPKELMNHVSFVFQNTKLFKKSLLDNIRYGAPDAGLADVERVVELAQCREIIDKLPDGLYTKIGAEGTYLSGGEQQRIALARAK